MQNARVIQLGSSGVKVTRNSASFEEAFGGYSKKRKQKYSNFNFNDVLSNPFLNPAIMVGAVYNAVNPSATPTTSNAPNPLTANLPIVYDSPRDYILMPIMANNTTTNLLKAGGGTKAFPNNQPLKMVRAYKIYNGQPIEVNLAIMESGVAYLVPIVSKAKDVLTGLTANLLPANPTGSTSSSPITAQSVIYDSPRNYKLINANGQLTPLTANLLKVGGGTKAFPTNQPLSMIRAYKSNGGQITDVNLAVMENGVPYLVPNLNLAVDILTGMTANTLPANPTGSTSSYAENQVITNTGTTPTTDGIGTAIGYGASTTSATKLEDKLKDYTAENVGRLLSTANMQPILFGSYKVVSDVNGANIGKADDGTTKTFAKDSIVSAYLQPFNNPSNINNGKKSAYWIVNAEVPTTSNTSTQTSSNPNNASKTTMVNKSFKLRKSALGENIAPTDPNSGGGNADPSTGGGNANPNTGGGNADPNQGGGASGGGVYTGGGSSSADLDALNAQIEAQQMAQYQQEGGGQQQPEGAVNPYGYVSPYIPTQDELMVDIDTNYAPDSEDESSFNGYGKSNAMETKINDLATKIAWNKEMAEMLKKKKGVDKTALKEEYMNKVARVNELLRELKGCETPANREYILKMIAKCDMMRPSMKNKFKKDIVIQNANPKIIDLGNATPSEFRNDLGKTIMEDEDSSFMGDVIEYSDFSGSSTTTALMGVGIGAVLGIIGIVVINKMKK